MVPDLEALRTGHPEPVERRRSGGSQRKGVRSTDGRRMDGGLFAVV